MGVRVGEVANVFLRVPLPWMESTHSVWLHHKDPPPNPHSHWIVFVSWGTRQDVEGSLIRGRRDLCLPLVLFLDICLGLEDCGPVVTPSLMVTQSYWSLMARSGNTSLPWSFLEDVGNTVFLPSLGGQLSFPWFLPYLFQTVSKAFMDYPHLTFTSDFLREFWLCHRQASGKPQLHLQNGLVLVNPNPIKSPNIKFQRENVFKIQLLIFRLLLMLF